MCSINKKEEGFTLIEVMMVVSLITILSGISISILNRNQQQNRAKDAKNLSSLTKVVSAVESYYYSEGRYPLKNTNVGVTNGDPTTLASNSSIGEYIRTWPGLDFYYITDASPTTKFAIYVKKNADTKYYKYRSSTETIAECSATGITTVDTCSP